MAREEVSKIWYNLCLKKASYFFNDALWNAAFGGHLDLINFLLEIGPKDYESILMGASYGGHLDIIKMAIEMVRTILIKL